MEQILRTLIGLPTVTGDHVASSQALNYITDFTQQRGMHVRRFESNGFLSLVATTTPHDLTPTVLLVAHVDTVPGPPEMLSLRVEDGNYLGRGVYDMKSGLAAFLQAIDMLKDELPHLSLGLMVTADEEVGGRNGVGHLVQHGYRPKVCIIPDGGDNWRIETFEKGTQWIKLEAHGIAGHASRPWEGEHAIHKLLGALADIRTVFPTDVGREETILSVGVVKGGTTANQLAEYAEAMLDVRTGSKTSHSQVFTQVAQACEPHEVLATLLVDDPPCMNSLEDPYIARFKDLIVATVGDWGGPAYSYGMTDGRYFSNHGIPCIITMPEGGGWHAANEWASVKGCDQYSQIVQQFIREVAMRPLQVENPQQVMQKVA